MDARVFRELCGALFLLRGPSTGLGLAEAEAQALLRCSYW